MAGILTLVFILMILVYLRWIILAIVGISVTIGSGLIAGIVVTIITHYALKLCTVYLAWLTAKKVHHAGKQHK